MIKPAPGTVTVYVTRTCPYCHAVKRLLSTLGVAYNEIDVSYDNEARMWLASASGRRTVPQVFVGEAPIGGYDDTRALLRGGQLQSMLAHEGVDYIAGGA